MQNCILGGAGTDHSTIETEAEARQDAPELLRNRDFLLLWAGQFVSQVGDRLAALAFPWLVYTTTRSELGTGAVFAIYTLPYVLFGAGAGVLIDRVDRRRAMVAIDALRAGLVVLVPLVARASLAPVFVLGFLIASAGVFFEPAKLAIVPEIVPKERLLRANSLLSTGENLTEVIGWAAAGLLLAAVSTTTAFVLDAATFLVSAVALTAIRYRSPLRAAAQRSARAFWGELREGLAFLRGHRGLLANTLMVVASAAGLGAAYPLMFLLAVQVFGGGTKAFGTLEAATGAGYLAGSLALAAVAPRVRKGVAITLGLGLMGVFLALVGTSGSVVAACVPIFAFGAANAVALVAVDTYLQEVVPEQLRGRVLGTRFTLTQGAYALSVLAGGALAAAFPVRALLVTAGVLVGVPGFVGLLVRDVREA